MNYNLYNLQKTFKMISSKQAQLKDTQYQDCQKHIKYLYVASIFILLKIKRLSMRFSQIQVRLIALHM